MSHPKAFQIAHITLLSLLLTAGLGTVILAMISTYLLKYGDWTAIFSLLTISGLLLLLGSIYYLIMITTPLGRDNHPIAAVGGEMILFGVGWALSLATTIKIGTYGRWDNCDGLCLSEICGIALSSASLIELTLLLLTLLLFTRSHGHSPISTSGSVWRDNTRSHLERALTGGFGRLGKNGSGVGSGTGSQVDLRVAGGEGYGA